MNEYYKLVLQLKDRMSLYYDEEEYKEYRDALTIAIFVAKYGYPFGEQCIPVVLVSIIHITKELPSIRGEWLAEEDYEEYKKSGLIKL